MACAEFPQYPTAEELLRESLALHARPPRRWTHAQTQAQLGAVLLRQRQFADAEKLLLGSYLDLSERKAERPKNSQPVAECRDELVRLYCETQEVGKAETYRKLRAGYPREMAPRPRTP